MKRKNEIRNNIIGYSIFAIAAIIIIAGISAAAFGWQCVRCNQTTNNIGFPHRYTIFGGCQVQINGSWIPLENYRFIGD